jgi:hypothetical protein
MKKILWIILFVVVLWLAWRWWHGPAQDASAGRGQEIFYGRAWVDHLPASQTDTFHVFGALQRDPIGWMSERSVWKGEWELFRYEPRGDGQVELLFPHSKTKVRISYRAWKCSDKKEFDYCLEISGGRRPGKYYSRRGWEKSTLDEARALEAQLLTP